MSLLRIQKDCEDTARGLIIEAKNSKGEVIGTKKYSEATPQELADGYCEAEEQGNEKLRNKYWAALLLRYWYKIYEWKRTCISLGLPEESYFDWLHDSLRDAFWYRSWRPIRLDPKGNWIQNPQYRPDDPYAADRSIHYFLNARRGKEYQLANKHIRKGNYQTVSIDKTFDETGYHILDTVGLKEESSYVDGIEELIKLLVKKSKVMEAVVIDLIANKDLLKTSVQKKVETWYDEEEKKEVKNINRSYSYSVNNRRLVQSLISLDDEYFEKYFTKKYKLKDYKPYLQEIKSLSNPKLYKVVERTFETIKQSPDLVSCLMPN